MRDIQQLLEAHTVLTKFKRAESQLRTTGGDLKAIARAVDSLVSEPGRGRRTEVDAVNRAAMVLLCAHLQGYVEDVYTEAATALLAGKVTDIDSLVKQALSSFSNPHADRIVRLFASIGLPNVMSGVSWQKTSNQTVRQRLTDYIRVRNSIAHGGQDKITKQKVVGFRRFVDVFVRNFDEKVRSEIQAVAGKTPW